jgi:hypothetical protein
MTSVEQFDRKGAQKVGVNSFFQHVLDGEMVKGAVCISTSYSSTQ